LKFGGLGFYSFNPYRFQKEDCYRISANAQLLTVIPDLIRNPVLFDRFSELDAGSVIPDLIRDRHDIRATSAYVYPLKTLNLLAQRGTGVE
jgi:hypothetical protein